MGFSLEVFPMGGVHNEYQRPTKKEKRAAAGKATVCGALSIELTEAVAFKWRGVLVMPSSEAMDAGGKVGADIGT
jgi:hypothetical protein